MRPKHALAVLLAMGLLGAAISVQRARSASNSQCKAKISAFANVATKQFNGVIAYQFRIVVDVTADPNYDVSGWADLSGAAGNYTELHAKGLHIGRNEYDRWMNPYPSPVPGNRETIVFHLECDVDPDSVGDELTVTATTRTQVYRLGEARPADNAVSRPANPINGCAPIDVVDTRGSGAPAGLSGPDVVFANALKARLPGTKVESNPYQAFGNFGDLVTGLFSLQLFAGYEQSTADGERWLTTHLRRLAQLCAATKVILVGHSQGAQVAADVFQSRKLQDWPEIVAVVLFGDPKFNPSDPVDQGSSSRSYHGALGTRPLFNGGEAVVLSYCHGRDPVCQKSPLSWLHLLFQHDNYNKLGEPQKAAATIASFN